MTVHGDPVTPVVLALAVILAVAKIAGHLSARIGQPAVLGELVAGVLLGNMDLAGITWFESIKADPTVDILAATALVLCFALAYLASTIGLAPIVGAYAAGLILEEAHFRSFVDRGEQQLEHLVHPISMFLVPVFFVTMGTRVNLRAFARIEVLGLAAILTIAATVGKQACSLGVIGRRFDRMSIGIGMIPRGEVGLIFANIGLGLNIAGQPIVDEAIFSALVIMVVVTTMVTPPALKWSLARHRRADGGGLRH